MCADETSLFSVIHGKNTSGTELIDNFSVIKNWPFPWKISFILDPSKQAQQVSFSKKTKKVNHSPIISKNIAVILTTFRKHLGVILDSRLTFDNHLNNIQSKNNKAIRLLCNLQNTLPRPALITIYKVFIRPYLDYDDIFYDQVCNTSLHQILEKYNALLV